MPSPAGLIASPYDPQARYSSKRGTAWVGYKVQLTETCDPDLPSLIVNVATTPATTPDDNMLAAVHASLAARDLLPGEHLVDKGYTDSHVLVDSRRASASRSSVRSPTTRAGRRARARGSPRRRSWSTGSGRW